MLERVSVYFEQREDSKRSDFSKNLQILSLKANVLYLFRNCHF